MTDILDPAEYPVSSTAIPVFTRFGKQRGGPRLPGWKRRVRPERLLTRQSGCLSSYCRTSRKVDPATRKLIRSHARRGKAKKRIRSGEEQEVAKTEMRTSHAQRARLDFERSDRDVYVTSAPPRGIGSLLRRAARRFRAVDASGYDKESVPPEPSMLQGPNWTWI